MHGPTTGRRPVEETANPQKGASERLRSGKWLAGVAGGAIAFPIAVLLHELGHFGAYAVCRLGRRAVLRAHGGGRPGGRGGDCRTVARGGRRGCRADGLLPDHHGLRARGPPIRPRPPFSGLRSRVGDPVPLDVADSDPFPDAPRRASHRGPGRDCRPRARAIRCWQPCGLTAPRYPSEQDAGWTLILTSSALSFRVSSRSSPLA